MTAAGSGTGSPASSASPDSSTPGSPNSGSTARSVRARIEAVHGELGKLELGSALTDAIEHLDALDRHLTALSEEHQRIREANATLAEHVVLLRAENERVLQASAGLAQAIAGSDERLDDLRFALADTGREVAGVVQQAIAVTTSAPAPEPGPAAKGPTGKSPTGKTPAAKSPATKSEGSTKSAGKEKPAGDPKAGDAKTDAPSGAAKGEDPAANGAS